MDAIAHAALDRDFPFGARPGCLPPERPFDDPLVRLQVIAIGHRELAADVAAFADAFDRGEIQFLALHARDARAQHRQQPRRRIGFHRREHRSQRVGLILLHVDQEHVGRVRLQRDGEFARQVHLEQPHAEDEEHAEADGQQNHPGLMTGTPEPIDRVTHREPLHASERPHRAHHREPDEVQGDRREHEPDRHDAAHPPRRRLPAREQHEHATTDHGEPRRSSPSHADGAAHAPIASSARLRGGWRRRADGRRRLLAQQQQRTHAPHFEQRHEREQQRHQHADAEGLETGGERQADRDRAERGEGVGRRGQQHQRAEREAHQAAGRAEQQHLHDVDAEHLRDRRADALQHGDALQLLLDEDARHAPDADAAEHDHHVADQPEIVLRDLQLLADAVFVVAVRPHRHQCVAERDAQIARQPFEARRIVDAHQPLIARAAAETDQAGARADRRRRSARAGRT